MSKVQELLGIEGFSSIDEVIDEYGHDSIAPCICTNAGCEYVTHAEHDCRDGHCPLCGTATVASVFDLLGVI